MSPLEQIHDFLDHKRVAMVGVSRNAGDFSRGLFREFVARGYDMVPVHPAEEQIEGRSCYKRLQEIQPPVDGVLFMTPPAMTEKLVADCAQAGIRRVWMFRGVGRGAATANTVNTCEDMGMSVIAECPYMFFPRTGWIHKCHGLVRKIRGRYPD